MDGCMDGCVRPSMNDLFNGRAGLYKCTSEENTPSHIWQDKSNRLLATASGPSRFRRHLWPRPRAGRASTNVVVPKLRRAKMRLMVVSLGDFSLSPIAQCDGLEARPRPGRKPAVVEAEMTGNAECDELTEWHEAGWIY